VVIPGIAWVSLRTSIRIGLGLADKVDQIGRPLNLSGVAQFQWW